jgi:hypothetical protein
VRTIAAVDLHDVCGGAADSQACRTAVWRAGDTAEAYSPGVGGLAGLAAGTVRAVRRNTIGAAGWIPAGALIGATVATYGAPPIARFVTKHFGSACAR